MKGIDSLRYAHYVLRTAQHFLHSPDQNQREKVERMKTLAENYIREHEGKGRK